MGSSNSLLELRGVSISFGGLKVIENLSMTVNEGELVGLIGPNGAGKTTAFNLISGIYRPTSGEIRFQGRNLQSLGPAEVCAGGIVRTFQNIRLFQRMSVLENIMVSMHKDCDYGLWATLWKTRKFSNAESEFQSRAEELLDIFGLSAVAQAEAGSLPYGQQRKLEIVRALASRPRLILLDEPAAGMNHSEKDELMVLIQKIRQQFQLTVLLIEHDMKLVMGICERIFVLDHGVVIAEGTPADIQNNKRVIEAYLGVEEGANA